MISAIVAVERNNVIGNSNEVPWYLPADLRHFKEITTGHPVIMGRTTYDSIVKSLGRSLPNRQNIVITRNAGLELEDASVATTIEAACAQAVGDEAFIIGGAQVYALASPLIDRWYVTEIDTSIEGDVVLDGFNKAEFNEVSRQSHQADEKNKYNYDFVIYERK